ncbi:hypothetical protein T3A99_05545 [Pseudomonas sp. N-137]|uniref:hypothetical protein n=1 Tax=Pseudomonas sp. N-137 TaxID=3108452 RepID=UPI002ADED0F1|nr:hypothetical protein [Pseudomonas sp. N-137]MEA1028035.1 hypothetical protein [Pseudomonas sp. N-137]
MLFYARRLKQTLEQLDSELGEYALGIKGHVRIHAITSALSQFLLDDVAGFVALYPQIKFDIEEKIGSAVIRGVEDGRADPGHQARHHHSVHAQCLQGAQCGHSGFHHAVHCECAVGGVGCLRRHCLQRCFGSAGTKDRSKN